MIPDRRVNALIAEVAVNTTTVFRRLMAHVRSGTMSTGELNAIAQKAGAVMDYQTVAAVMMVFTALRREGGGAWAQAVALDTMDAAASAPGTAAPAPPPGPSVRRTGAPVPGAMPAWLQDVLRRRF